MSSWLKALLKPNPPGLVLVSGRLLVLEGPALSRLRAHQSFQVRYVALVLVKLAGNLAEDGADGHLRPTLPGHDFVLPSDHRA